MLEVSHLLMCGNSYCKCTYFLLITDKICSLNYHIIEGICMHGSASLVVFHFDIFPFSVHSSVDST